MRAQEFLHQITEDASQGIPAWRIRFRRFNNLPAVIPEREGRVYLMPTDPSALRTFGSLTGKDFSKINNMPTEAYQVSGDARVGDMQIINRLLNAMQDLEKNQKKQTPDSVKQQQDYIEELKQRYLDGMVPLSQYRPGQFRMPEILAEPSQIQPMPRSVIYDKNTGEIVLRPKADLEEGWRDTVAGLALGAGVAMGSPAQASGTETVVVQPGQTVYSIARAFGTTPEIIQRLNRLGPDFRIEPNQELRVPLVKTVTVPAQTTAKPSTARPAKPTAKPGDQTKPAEKIKTKTGNPRESLLRQAAAAGGITNPVELAAFLAQSTIETGGFGSLDEKGGRRRIERMYDPKYNPKGAERIGNTKVGDGWRYRGRGFLQLTGRYNYTEAGRALGLNLAKNPDLVLKPEVAARTAVWYWKWRVRPNVDNNYYDTERITALVQGADSHLERRKKAFRDFLQFQMAQI